MGALVLAMVLSTDAGVSEVAADDPPTPAAMLAAATVQSELVDQLLDDGRHQRFGTASRGPVHVWRPRTYTARTAATVVYLHGLYTDVDRAVLEHQLITQFRESGRNALFIVPMARSGRGDPVWWPDLGELLDAVRSRLDLTLPGGPVVVVGHSGAYRTVVRWLAHLGLRQVLLVDGLYGADADFAAWLDAPGHQLVLIGFDTHLRADGFGARRGAVRLETVPYLYDELPASTRKARLVIIESERFDHMGLVTGGTLLPWLLRAFR